MQRILITGGAGFIGSHLVDTLLDAGHEVIVLDDLSVGTRRNLAHWWDHPMFQFVKGSILDIGRVTELAARVDAIYHLAAVVGVKYIVDNPLLGIRVNALGTNVVLEAAARYKVRILIASSSEVYGKSTRVPFSEGDDSVLGSTSVPRWSYAVSKLLDEHLALAYYHQHALPTVVVRYFNAYGPRLDPRGYGSVIARFITQAMARKPLTVYGSGQQTRAFTFVRDTVRGTVAAMESERGIGKSFNIGNPKEVSIGSLAFQIRDLVGVPVDIVHVPYAQAFGANFEESSRRLPDVSLARELLGFETRIPLEEGLRTTVEWFKEHRDEFISA